MCLSILVSSVCMPSSGIARSYGSSIYYWIVGLLYISFARYVFCDYFLPVCSFSFPFLNSIFWWEVLNLIKPNLPFFPFYDYWFFLNLTGQSVNHSAVFNSLWPRGLQPSRLLCPWDSPGKSTGVGSHSLLQGIFLTQGSDLGLLHCRQIFNHLSHQGS